MADTARVRVYESDALMTFAERLDDVNDYEDWYDLPEPLIAAYEAAEAALDVAMEAIKGHIRDDRLPRHESRY